MKFKSVLAVGVGISAALLVSSFIGSSVKSSLSIEDATVMVVRLSGRGGGSGVIISNTPSESRILTNAHVCRAIEATGGSVITRHRGQHLVAAYQISERFDLCLVSVDADLGIHSPVASSAPAAFERSTNIGHPQLLPTVITEGYFGDYSYITIVSRFRKCTEAEKEASSACSFLEGIPVISTYNSRLSTSFSSPGSSGSPVYNSKGEVAALVFAGRGAISYSWTVPTESINQFLAKEVKQDKLKPGLFEYDDKESVEYGVAMTKLIEVCTNFPEVLDTETQKVCEVVTRAHLLPLLD